MTSNAVAWLDCSDVKKNVAYFWSKRFFSQFFQISFYLNFTAHWSAIPNLQLLQGSFDIALPILVLFSQEGEVKEVSETAVLLPEEKNQVCMYGSKVSKFLNFILYLIQYFVRFFIKFFYVYYIYSCSI